MRASLMCHPKKVSITNSNGKTFNLIEGYALPNIYRIENMSQTSITNVQLTEEGEVTLSNSTTFSYNYSNPTHYIINYSIITDNKSSLKYINDSFCGTILQDGSIEIETDTVSLKITGDGSTVTFNLYKLKCLGIKINTIKTYSKTLYRASAPIKEDLVLPSNCVILDLPTVSKGTKTNLQAYFYKVKYANNTYVAFIYNQESSAYEIVYSKDGITWGKTSGINAFSDNADFVYVNGVWSLIVSSGFYYSTDGITWVNTNNSITWKSSNSIYFGSSCNYDNYIHMVYANGIYLASAGSIYSSYGYNLFYSTDGKTWTQSNNTHRIKFIEHNNNYWMTAGDGSSSESYYKSDDGLSWVSYGRMSGTTNKIIGQISFNAHRGIIYNLFDLNTSSSKYKHYLSVFKGSTFSDIAFIDADSLTQYEMNSYTGKMFPTAEESSSYRGRYDFFYGCGKFIARGKTISDTSAILNYSDEGKYTTKAKYFCEYSCPVCRQGSYNISRYSSEYLRYQNCQNTLCIIQSTSTYADGNAIAYTEDATVWRSANINNPHKVQNTWFVADDDGYIYTYKTNHTLIPNYTEVEYDKI